MTPTLNGIGIWNSGLRFGDEKQACQAAAEAEDLGYSAVWMPDIGGDDLFPRLAALLGATNRIVIASGVLNLWMHDAATVSARYTELAAQYPDRLLLGIGVSNASLIDQIGVGTYQKPVAKMNAYLDGLDAASPPVPIGARVLAALGPKMLATARERSAGAHPYLVGPEHTAVARQALGPDKTLAPEVGVVLESDPAKAREIARLGLATYFGVPSYENNWRRYFSEQDIAAPGSDKLVDTLVAWGDEETIAAKLQLHCDAGADHVCIQVLTGKPVTEPDFPAEQWARLAPFLVH
jgi:probable F420-dependent oxidoreductase